MSEPQSGLVRRFGFIEEALAEQRRRPEQSDLAETDALWRDAKRVERLTGYSREADG